MANQSDIKKYLMEGEHSYLNQENRNGEILMLSGVWGSGKTHFWKNEVEKELIGELKKKDKSYVFISLYGKDSIEELQNEIYQLSYNFSIEGSSDIISSACSVFTKVTSFMPKISVFGIEVELDKSAAKVQAEKIKQQIEKGISKLMNGGVICFDDFERKSSKIDLNDLFGFITNLTEVFKTKTIIITNQEFFKERDSEVFSRIKEKSVNKFLLLDPTVDELFETIYKEKYRALDAYKKEVLKAIKITEEKNARIYIQVLDNCLKYKSHVKEKSEIFLLVLITVIFVKYNLIFRMGNIKVGGGIASHDQFLPNYAEIIPGAIVNKIAFKLSSPKVIKATFIDKLKRSIEQKNENKKEENLKEDFLFIENNQDMLYQIYKYNVETEYFKEEDTELIEKLNNFVESGILVDENVRK
ncbi:MAG: P-loop NTPase fold protein [Sulfurimonas sp.]|jgi:tRNA A37 threonylcarbamoyladenosine biosynthesis protein TsaE